MRKKLCSLIIFLVAFSCYSQTIQPSGPVSFCPGGSVVLTVSGATGSPSFKWKLNGTDIPGATSVSYTAAASGNYTVQLTGGGSPGIYGPAVVTVNPNPVAAFNFSPNNSCGEVPVSFTDGSTGSGLNYSWDFGDPNSGTNNSSTNQNPVHKFVGNPGNSSQTFSVKLTVTSSSGCTNSVTNIVTAKQLPDASLGGTGATTYGGLPYFRQCGTTSALFNFTNLSSTIASNANYRIEWGDGSPAFSSPTFVVTTHTYSTGTFPLLFIVTGNNGCIDTSYYFVFVGSNPAVGLGNPGNTSICTGESLTFPITGTASNPPGTVYTVTFNDGTAPIIYIHPNVPTSITHTFNITSCGTTSSDGSSSYTNSFSCRIVASNPCGTSAASIVPIYVSTKPVANFTIAPKDTVCVNTNVTLTNTSNNNYIDNNGQCITGNPVWVISPATGWSLTGGNLGNDFGLNDPSAWQPGSNVLSLIFTVPGTYTVKLKTGNPTCGIDSIVKTICVNPVPTASFTVDQNTGCAPLTVNTVTTTNTPICGVYQYNWTVTYTPSAGCLPATAGYSFLNGTNAGSAQPTFLFTNPGIYTIGLVVSGPTCSAPLVTRQVIVKGKPVVTLTALPPGTCANQSVTPTANATCYIDSATTYAWSFPGGTPSSSSLANPGTIIYTTPGTYNISLSVTNECGTTTVTQQLLVDSVTTSVAGTSQATCGTSVTLTGNVPVNGTGLWTMLSGPNNPVITNPASPVTTVTGMIPGTYVFQWIITNGGCSSSSTVTVTILPGGTVAVAGPDQTLCLSTVASLNANTPVSGTGIWTLVSGPGTPVITAPSSPSTTVTGLVTGAYIFRWTISFSNCTPSSDDVQVTIYDNPGIADAGPDQTICASIITLAGNVPSNGTGLWTSISGPNTPFITTPGSPTTIVTGLAAGIYLFKWTISNGSCPSNSDTVQVTVTGTPTIAAAGPDQALCSATAVSLAGNIPVTGTGLWTMTAGPNVPAITNPISAATTVTGLIPGVYTFRWTISSGGCSSSSDDVTITVGNGVTAADAGPPQITCGTSATMAANAAVTGTGVWTMLSGPNSPVITNPASPLTTITGMIPGAYVFQWTISNGGCVSSSTVAITIVPGGTTADAGPDQDLCLATLTSLAANIPATGTGSWTLVSGPGSPVITTPFSPLTTITGLTPGTYIFRWTISFSNCSPSTDDVQVNIYDNPSAPDAGPDQTICSAVATLSANVPATGKGSWTSISGPNSPSITSPDSATTTVTGLVAGTYFFVWTISNGNCPSIQDTVSITVTGTPSLAAAGPDQTLCSTTSVTLAGNTPVTGAGIWTMTAGPNVPTINNPASPSTSVTGLIPGTYTFRWTIGSGGCSASSDDVSIIINDVTTADAGIAQTTCGTFITLAGNTPVTGTGLWTMLSGPNSPVITSPGSPLTTVTGTMPGTYVFQWTITNGSCTSSSTVSITIIAGGTIASAGPDQALCFATQVSLSANTPVNGAGSWTLISGPGTALITTPSSPSTTVTGITPGTYIFRWTISIGSCTPSTDDVQIIIYDDPGVPDAGPDQAICSPVATLAATVPAAGAGLWTIISGPNPPNITTPTSPTTTVTGLVAGTYLFKWTISNGNCPSIADTVQVTVSGTPTIAAAGPDQVLCSATTITLSGNNPITGTGAWTMTTGPNVPTITNPFSFSTTVTGLIPGVYTFRWTITNGSCSASSDEAIITIDSIITADAGSPQVICGTSATMAANASGSGTGFWTILSAPNNPVITNPASPVTTITGMVPGTYLFKWTVTNGTCVTSSAVPVTIVSGGSVANAGPDQGLCLATDISLSANTPVNGTGFWTLVSGPGTPVINIPSSPSTIVTGLIPGNYTFRWTISFSNCTPSNDDVQVIIYDDPTMADAGPDQTICLPVATLSGNLPVTGTGLWTIISGPNPPVITTPTSASTTVTGLVPGTYLFKWTISNGNCPSNADTVEITVSGSPTTATAGPDQILCAATSITLSGNNPVLGTGSWTMTAGPNVPTITNPSSPSTTVTGLIPGVYTFRWTITNGTCSASTDDVTIDIKADIINHIDTTTQSVCAGQQVIINGSLPTGGGGVYSYQWQQSFDGINFTDLAGATNQHLIFIPVQSVFLRRFVSSPPCANYSDTAHIIVQAALSNNLISADAGICINTIAPVISGSLPTGGNNQYSIQWEISNDNGVTWNLIPGAVTQNYSPGILSQTTKFRRKISSGLCIGANTSNVVTITVNPNARAVYNPLDSIGCAPWLLDNALVNAQAFPAQNAQYLWYVNNNLISSGLPFAGYTMLNNDDTIVLKLKTTSLYGCLDDSVSHIFITRKTATPAFTISDTSGCGPLTIQIQNTTPSANLYSFQWDFGNGQTSTATQPGAVTYQPNSNYGDTTYIIRLKIFTACDTLTISKPVVIHSRPKALFTPGSTFGCSPISVRFNNSSKGINNTYYWDFGDGTNLTTTLADTFSHVYNTAVRDTFYVTLKATNNCGSDSMRYSIIVSPENVHLDFQVNGNEIFGCAPHTVHFINNSNGATTFSWNFGDGTILNTTRNIDTVTHTFLLPGIYQVQVRASNACSDTMMIKTITVFGKPVANFIANKYSACIGDTIRFTNQSDSATSYLWQFGDGTTSTLQNPSHSYLQPGTYNVVLKSSKFYASGTGCTDSVMKQVTIVGNLPGSFDMKDTVGSCAPITITFTNKNLPSISATWDFGDGTTGVGDVISHTFYAAGVYVVKLVVKVPGGCTYLSQSTVTVPGPSGTLQYTSGYVCNQQSVRFEVTSGNSDSLTWDFGDGSSLTTAQKIIFHTYPFAGIYVPKVTLKSNPGCHVLLSGTDTIRIDKIKAGFTSSQQPSCGTTNVNFTDTSHAYFGLSSRKWNFGDGTTGSGISVTHNYLSAGNYNVQLIITGNSGCSDTINKIVPVTIHNKPVVGIQGDTTGCSFSSLTFNAVMQGVDSINFISWTSSNGLTGNANSLRTTFTQPGNYTIRLVAGTVYGCFDTTFHTIHIDPSPQINAGNDFTICRGNTVQLSVTGAQQYIWSPAQGLSCTACANPLANPLITTQYLVKATNAFGCAGYDTVVVNVLQPFRMTVSGNDSICIGQSSNLSASGATSYLWSPSTGLSATNISNPVATPATTTRYRVVGYDGFNCFTDTGYVTIGVGQYPTVNLGPDLTLPSGTLYSFTPVIQNGPVRSWLWSPGADLNCTTCPLPVATIKKDITYFVTVKNSYGCPASDTINIKVFCESSQLFIPNAFSPDGDGINDILTVRAKGIVTVKSFRIFNRWGELIFEKINFRPNEPELGWDGKIRGVVGGPDVFVYTAEVICENGASFIYKGNTSIIK